MTAEEDSEGKGLIMKSSRRGQVKEERDVSVTLDNDLQKEYFVRPESVPEVPLPTLYQHVIFIIDVSVRITLRTRK